MALHSLLALPRACLFIHFEFTMGKKKNHTSHTRRQQRWRQQQSMKANGSFCRTCTTVACWLFDNIYLLLMKLQTNGNDGISLIHLLSRGLNGKRIGQENQKKRKKRTTSRKNGVQFKEQLLRVTGCQLPSECLSN